MARPQRVDRLLAAAVALRRAAREARDPRSAKRARRAELRLREELAGAVPKTAAARFLGVSTTALERWVDAGRLPVLKKPGGREQLALDAFLDVAEEVQVLREAGVARGVVAEALRRLERRGLPRRRLRPNESPRELRASYLHSTPEDRLRETAELSFAVTTLARYGASGRG